MFSSSLSAVSPTPPTSPSGQEPSDSSRWKPDHVRIAFMTHYKAMPNQSVRVRVGLRVLNPIKKKKLLVKFS